MHKMLILMTQNRSKHLQRKSSDVAAEDLVAEVVDVAEDLLAEAAVVLDSQRTRVQHLHRRSTMQIRRSKEMSVCG